MRAVCRILLTAVMAQVACLPDLTADGLCKPYAFAGKIAVDPVAPYLPFMLSVGTRPGPENNVRLVGDEVVISREIVGNLVKRANAIDRTLKSLTVDARRIVIRDSLAFADAEIRLIAHEIEFADGGVITLVPSPGKPIKLFAERITLPKTRFLQFDVRPRRKGDDFADIAKLVEVSASELRVGSTVIPQAAATSALAARFTLAPIFDFTPKIAVQLDQQGFQAWKTEMKRAEWPAYTVGVWRAGFRVSPFDPNYTSRLAPILARYDALLNGIAPASVLFDLRSLRHSVDIGVDSDGNGSAWAPVVPLSRLRLEILKFQTPGNGRLAILDSLRRLLESARDRAPVNTAPLLAEASGKIKELATEQRRVRLRLADIANELDGQQVFLRQVTDDYKRREDRLKQHAADLERGAQSRQQLISGLATAVSIVTTAYTGNPQAGALAGGVIIAIGASDSGKNTVESLSAGYAFYDQVRKPLESSAKALRELDASKRLYEQFVTSFTLGNITIKEFIEVPTPGPPPGVKRVTREQALDELGAKGNAVYTGASEVIDVYKKFSAPAATVPPVVEEDEDLKRLAGEITTGLEKVKNLTLELESMQRTSADVDRKLVAESERSAQIAIVDVNNEEERRALLAFVISLLRDEVSHFADTVVNIRKLSLVEYREDLPVDPEELRRMFVASEVSSAFDPTSVLNETAVLNQYIAFIGSTQTYMQLLATRIDRALSRQFETFIARRGTGPAIAYVSHNYRKRLFRETVDGQVIDEINRVLREQFAARADSERWQTLSQQRVRMPLDLSERVSGLYPLRFIQAAVVGLRGSRLGSANDVTLTLELARVGNFRQKTHFVAPAPTPPELDCGCRADEECYSVDFRAKESRPDQYFWWRDFSLADIRSGQTLLRTPDLSFWFLDPSDTAHPAGRTVALSYPPAEAELYLRVRLDRNTPHIEAPRISSLTLKVEVFQ